MEMIDAYLDVPGEIRLKSRKRAASPSARSPGTRCAASPTRSHWRRCWPQKPPASRHRVRLGQL